MMRGSVILITVQWIFPPGGVGKPRMARQLLDIRTGSIWTGESAPWIATACELYTRYRLRTTWGQDRAFKELVADRTARVSPGSSVAHASATRGLHVHEALGPGRRATTLILILLLNPDHLFDVLSTGILNSCRRNSCIHNQPQSFIELSYDFPHKSTSLRGSFNFL